MKSLFTGFGFRDFFDNLLRLRNFTFQRKRTSVPAMSSQTCAPLGNLVLTTKRLDASNMMWAHDKSPANKGSSSHRVLSRRESNASLTENGRFCRKASHSTNVSVASSSLLNTPNQTHIGSTAQGDEVVVEHHNWMGVAKTNTHGYVNFARLEDPRPFVLEQFHSLTPEGRFGVSEEARCLVRQINNFIGDSDDEENYENSDCNNDVLAAGVEGQSVEKINALPESIQNKEAKKSSGTEGRHVCNDGICLLHPICGHPMNTVEETSHCVRCFASLSSAEALGRMAIYRDYSTAVHSLEASKEASIRSAQHKHSMSGLYATLLHATGSQESNGRYQMTAYAWMRWVILHTTIAVAHEAISRRVVLADEKLLWAEMVDAFQREALRVRDAAAEKSVSSSAGVGERPVVLQKELLSKNHSVANLPPVSSQAANAAGNVAKKSTKENTGCCVVM